MKFQPLLVLGIGIVFLLVACGGSATSAPALTATSIPAPTATPRSDPTATAAPTATSNTGVLDQRQLLLPVDDN